MNNREFNTSEPLLEQDSQTGSSEAELPVSGSEPRQWSFSPQPENLDSPSFSTSENGNGVQNEADETSSEDEPESISPTAISLSVPNITYRLAGLIELLFADEQRTFLRVLLASSCLRRGNQVVFYWEESDICRDLHCRFWRALTDRSSLLVITHRERSFLEEFSRRPPYGIPTAIVNLFNFTRSPLLLGPRHSGQSIEALEMALAQISLKKFVGVVTCKSRGRSSREISRTSVSSASSKLLDSQTSSSKTQIWLERYITIIRSLSEIPRISESDASSELRDGQHPSSASENGMRESQIELKHCYDAESWASEDTSKDRSSLKDDSSDESSCEAQSSEMELKSEKNAGDSNLDEDSLVTKELDRDSAKPLHVPPEESSEVSPAKKSKMI